jgi:hypothetical protein
MAMNWTKGDKDSFRNFCRAASDNQLRNIETRELGRGDRVFAKIATAEIRRRERSRRAGSGLV